MSNGFRAYGYVLDLKIDNPTKKFVLSLLAGAAGDDFSCWPSVSLIAARVGISTRATQKHLKALREEGYISDRVRSRQNGSQATNRYFIHGPWDNFGGSGTPFEKIEIPSEVRATMWAKKPEDGEFRDGTIASVSAGGGGVSSSSPHTNRTSRDKFDRGGELQDTPGGAPQFAPLSSGTNPLPSLTVPKLAPRSGRGARRKEEDKIIKDFSHTHMDLVKPLVLELPGGVDAAQADEITRLVCAALDRGWAPSAVFARLREKCDLEKSRDPGAVHLYNARRLGEPSRAQAAKAAVELCRVCDEDGFTSDVSACSADPEAVPGVCLHGAADPWDDPEYRAERERERSEALYARQKAEEEARHRKSRAEAARRREAARRAADTERRRQAATRFLESEPPIGDETADTVRRIFLTADDPADLADLETLVSMGIDLVESGSSVLELVNITVTVPREKWLTAILDRFDPVPSDA